MAKDKSVTVVGAEEVHPEVFAAAIVRISEGMARLQAAGLNRRALLVLLKDATGVTQREIGLVLDALPRLAALYTVQKKARK